MVAQGGFRGIAGLRYDDVGFDADVPQQVNGTHADAFRRYHGGYAHLLPYVTLTQSFASDAWRLFYALPRGGEFRVAYQWADRNLNTVNAQPHQDHVLRARGQMNAALRWALTPNLTVKLEADNILGNDKSMMHGYCSERYTRSVTRKLFLDIVPTR